MSVVNVREARGGLATGEEAKMPNGGSDNCGTCTWFRSDEPYESGRELGRCELREVSIELPFWTTCRNWSPAPQTDNAVRTGPLISIVGWVEDGQGGYTRLAYCEGRRPDTCQRENTTLIQWTERDGDVREFETVDVYQVFRERREREDRARGLMVGAGLGNVLGIPYEGRRRTSAERLLRNAVRIIGECRFENPCDDDDLAQTVLVAESALDGPEMSALPERLWTWSELNGVGMGSLTGRVLREWSGEWSKRLAGRDGAPRPILPRDTLWDVSARCAEHLAGSGRDAGNGGLMRASPVAVPWADSPERLTEPTIAQCTATHAAPECVWSCLIYVARCACAIRNERSWEPVLHTLAVCERTMRQHLGSKRARPWHERYRDCPESIRKACVDADQKHNFASIAQGPGWGWTVTSLRMALEAERRWGMFEENDPAHILAAVIEGGGDADTHGCIAGALLGAHAGATEWPGEWREALRVRRRRMNAQERVAGKPRRPLEDWADLLLAVSAGTQPDARA